MVDIQRDYFCMACGELSVRISESDSNDIECFQCEICEFHYIVNNSVIIEFTHLTNCHLESSKGHRTYEKVMNEM